MPERDEAAIEARVRAMLLEEVKKGKLEWYWIATDRTGALIEARGPTEAWRLYHFLKLYPPGGGSTTATQVDRTITEEKIPPEDRWRSLSMDDMKRLKLVGG